MIDVGILQIGAQHARIYLTISEDDYEYILNHSEAELYFVYCDEVLDKVMVIQSKVKSHEKV